MKLLNQKKKKKPPCCLGYVKLRFSYRVQESYLNMKIEMQPDEMQ